jgi:hypothetical protein
MTDPTDPGGASHEFSTPREAAAALGVSPSGLRRLADIYAGVGGDLPRDPRTHSRIWPRQAVAELATARLLVAEKRTTTIRAALQAIRRGEADLRPDLAVRRLHAVERAAGQAAASPGGGAAGFALNQAGRDAAEGAAREVAREALNQAAREAAQDAAREAAHEAARQVGTEARLEARRTLAELADIARRLGEELIQARGELGSLRAALSEAMTAIAALRVELAAVANDSRQARPLIGRDSPGERGAHPPRDTEPGVDPAVLREAELRELRRRLRYLETEIEIRGL